MHQSSPAPPLRACLRLPISQTPHFAAPLRSLPHFPSHDGGKGNGKGPSTGLPWEGGRYRDSLHLFPAAGPEEPTRFLRGAPHRHSMPFCSYSLYKETCISCYLKGFLVGWEKFTSVQSSILTLSLGNFYCLVIPRVCFLRVIIFFSLFLFSPGRKELHAHCVHCVKFRKFAWRKLSTLNALFIPQGSQ